MSLRTRHPWRRPTVVALAGLLTLAGVGPTPPSSAETASAIASVTENPPTGTVVSSAPLPERLWIPGTRRAFLLEYVTTDTFGEPAHSTGTVFLPKGKAPRGGWPVISWAHGTSGLGDECAPSKIGPALPERDRAYLGAWMKQGYAIVASDYTGLGTPGLMTYLDGRTTAHSVVDMVKAGRRFTSRRLSPGQRLSRRWVTIGQSQGGGAAIYTARYATEFGGDDLRYLGAVGTGTPAHIEKLMIPLGPKTPAAALPPALTAYVAYIFTSLRYAHPELGIDGILTPVGEKYLAMAETECVVPFVEKLEGVSIGDFFAQPVATLPDFYATIHDYMGMPEDGFDKPFFMGHGLMDQDVPLATTVTYAATLLANGEPLTFKTYPSDHSGTLSASLADTVPFVRRLFEASRSR